MTDILSRAHGIDLSYWQTSLMQVASPPRPVDFVIQKLTEAVYTDGAYESLKKQIQFVPIRGGYHYLRGPAMGSWISQADVFLSRLTDDYHFWALDVEKAYNFKGLSLFDRPAEGFVESVVPWMDYVAAKSGRPGVLYTNPDMWATWLKPVQKYLLLYQLWISHYWYKPNPEGIPNYYTVRGAESMRRDWRFWQYDKNGQGGRGKEYGVQGKGLDLNVFNGSVDDLRAWLAMKPAPEPTGTGFPNTPLQLSFKTRRTNTYIFPEPRLSVKAIDRIPGAGTVVVVDQITDSGWAHIIDRGWVQRAALI
jgi:GH25 family lysozyme M1 (1,4-beta-N-acetylmuramidase)